MLNAKQSDTSCYNCVNGMVDDDRPRGSCTESLSCMCIAHKRNISESVFMLYMYRKEHRCKYFRRHNAVL